MRSLVRSVYIPAAEASARNNYTMTPGESKGAHFEIRTNQQCSDLPDCSRLLNGGHTCSLSRTNAVEFCCSVLLRCLPQRRKVHVQNEVIKQPRPTTVPSYVVIVGLGCLWLRTKGLPRACGAARRTARAAPQALGSDPACICAGLDISDLRKKKMCLYLSLPVILNIFCQCL